MGDAVVEVLVSSILRGNRGDGDGRERLGLNGGHLDLEEEKEEKKGGKGGKGGKGRKYKLAMNYKISLDNATYNEGNMSINKRGRTSRKRGERKARKEMSTLLGFQVWPPSSLCSAVRVNTLSRLRSFTIQINTCSLLFFSFFFFLFF